MPNYRVKEGLYFGSHRQHPGGAVIELTEKQALAFMDKLELVTDDSDQAPEPADAGNESGLSSLPDEVRKILTAGGYRDDKSIRAASDTELTDLSGIGPATLRLIRKATLPMERCTQ